MYKALKTWTREMMVFRSQIKLYVLRRTLDRKIGHRSDLQEHEDIQNISPDRLREVHSHLDYDAYCVSHLTLLSERYRALRYSTDSALEVANQTLAHVVLPSGRDSHQQVQAAVSRFENHVAAFNRDVNGLMLGVLLFDP